MGRAIVIGDVHGCLAELQDLLRATQAAPGDRLVSVGDLIGKGPDSRGVLEWARFPAILAASLTIRDEQNGPSDE